MQTNSEIANERNVCFFDLAIQARKVDFFFNHCLCLYNTNDKTYIF